MPASLLLSLLLLSLATPQQSVPDPRQAAAAQANAQADKVRQAEEMLEQGDYRGAEPALADLAKASPKDAHILFDLGFTQEHNGENVQASASYEAAIAADPDLAEPKVALGLLEARSGRADQARVVLNGAAQSTSASSALRARALRALARLDQTAHPDQAREDLAQAIKLTGEQPGDAELTAGFSSAAGNTVDAESTYRRALSENPGDVAATVELGSLLQHQGKLSEADALLTPALAAHPDDARLVAQSATLYAAEGKTGDALALLETLRAADSNAASDPALTRLLAHLYLVSGDAVKAEPLYRTLLQGAPQDPGLMDDLGSTLVRQQKFTDAQALFARAVGQRTAFHDDAAWGDAAGHLAFAASRNHQPEVVLQALDARATVLPNSPATLFLEATAHDTLHHRKEAERAYRAFLAMSNGKLPDEEFEARHRLIALEHER